MTPRVNLLFGSACQEKVASGEESLRLFLGKCASLFGRQGLTNMETRRLARWPLRNSRQRLAFQFFSHFTDFKIVMFMS